MVYTKTHWERHCAYKHTDQPWRINHHLPLIKINVAAFAAYKTQKVQAEGMKLERNTLPAHLRQPQQYWEVISWAEKFTTSQ